MRSLTKVVYAAGCVAPSAEQMQESTAFEDVLS